MQSAPLKFVQLLEHNRIFPEQKFLSKLVDVSDKKAVDQAIQEILSQFGKIDILVNNAGITRDGLLMKMSEEDWDRVIAVNLKSVYNTCQALVRPMLKARGGKIINISSVVGLMGNAGQTNYAASKAGMIGFTKSLAKEVASRGICVNCIAPGFIQTSMTDVLTDAQKEAILKQVPMGRLGSPEEIANAAVFLASSLVRLYDRTSADRRRRNGHVILNFETVKETMLMSSLEKDVIDIVVEQLGVDAADVTLEKSFIEDLNADSLDLTELIMTFEERFGFEISEEDAEKLKTVGDVVDYIKKKKGV